MTTYVDIDIPSRYSRCCSRTAQSRLQPIAFRQFPNPRCWSPSYFECEGSTQARGSGCAKSTAKVNPIFEVKSEPNSTTRQVRYIVGRGYRTTARDDHVKTIFEVIAGDCLPSPEAPWCILRPKDNIETISFAHTMRVLIPLCSWHWGAANISQQAKSPFPA